MMINATELFSLVINILLVILIVSLIVLTLNAIKTLNKVDRLVDDLIDKTNKLDGMFSIIGSVTDKAYGINDKISGVFKSTLNKILNRKKVR